MAVTHGHGNPNWNRDETILALEAYFVLARKNPSAKDPQIIALSQTLRALPYHGDAARTPTFRNPDGAAFKVRNLRSRATGKGLGNVSRMDRDIWDELGANPAEVTRLAALIRAGIAADHQGTTPEVDHGEEVEFYEGRLLTQSHMRRERSARLRKALLKKRQRDGMHCDICGEAHAALPAELRPAAFEAHHVVPIAAVGEGATKALRYCACLRYLPSTPAPVDRPSARLGRPRGSQGIDYRQYHTARLARPIAAPPIMPKTHVRARQLARRSPRPDLAPMSKYDPLAAFLQLQLEDVSVMSLGEIELVLGSSLPTEARAPRWWANDGSVHTRPQRRAWADAGYEARLVKGSNTVRFVRTTSARQRIA